MKNKIINDVIIAAFVLIIFVLTGFSACAQTLHLVTNGSSSYKIIVSINQPHDYEAAQQLSNYIKQVSGVNVPLLNDDVPVQDKEIVIGNNRHATSFSLPNAGNACIIKTHGNTLLLYGNNDDSSSADCVFYFAEKYLGWKVLSSDVSIIPHQTIIEIPIINESYISLFTYRDLYYQDSYDSVYTAFNRINHFNTGGQNRKWGEIWSSSFNYVIPAKKYFDTNPEYFALNEQGKRIPYQLDVSSDAMYNEYLKNFRQLMKRFPDSKVWSVAANDASAPNYCRCSKCEAINKHEGTPMGALLTFVNKIAAQFPDKIIATQAYMFYEEPPKTIKPAANVSIVECGSYLLDHSVPYESSTAQDAVTYRRRLNEWLALTKNVRIWDYAIDFFYLMCPFPNLNVQQKNLQYFAKLGIKDVFMQANISKGGEFAELRAYLLSKLLWNPHDNTNNIIDDFLNNYYGQAGKFIRQYLVLEHSAQIKSGISLTVHDSVSKHINGFLAPDLIIQYNDIFNKAENAIQNNTALLNRVKAARLPLMFAMLEISKKQPANKMLHASGYKNKQSLLNEFVQTCKKNHVVKLSEGAATIDSYNTSFISNLKK